MADQLALADTMLAAEAEVETAVYDGAPHSFFGHAFGEWQGACADARRRILALADRVAAGSTGSLAGRRAPTGSEDRTEERARSGATAEAP